MSYTLDENGTALTETKDGVTMPVDCSFEKVNDWVHGIDVQFEELQALCLGMAAENDRLRSAIELEADNNVLISIVERNIESLQSSVKMLRAILPIAGTFYLPVCESMAEAQDDIARSREFLGKLYQEGRYPPHP